MPIFQKVDEQKFEDVEQMKQNYAITTVVVSVITYFAAFASILLVERKHIKRRFLAWRQFKRDKTTVKGKPSPIPVAPAGPSPTPPGLNPPADRTAIFHGPGHGKEDLENAVDQGVTDAVKTRSLLAKWSCTVLSRRAGHKAPKTGLSA